MSWLLFFAMLLTKSDAQGVLFILWIISLSIGK